VDFYDKAVNAVAKAADEFQSPDGYSVDFYYLAEIGDEGETLGLEDSFNPLTGIQWISTSVGVSVAVAGLLFQSPDGYSVDFYGTHDSLHGSVPV
jgi:hypothetical protein